MQLLQTFFTIQIVSNAIGNVHENFIGSADFQVFLFNGSVSNILVGMILHRQPAEGLLNLEAVGQGADLQQVVKLLRTSQQEKQAEQKNTRMHVKSG